MDLTTVLTTSVNALAGKLQNVVNGDLPAVFLIMGAFLIIGCVWLLVRKAARVGGSGHRGRRRHHA